MKIAVGSDEVYDFHQIILKNLESRGHEVKLFGALKTLKEASWVETGVQVARAANKIQGIRAALCIDSETAKGARLWNSTNVLALSNRLLSPALAKEILNAWFSTTIDTKSIEELNLLVKIENN
ncbi:MAG: hypothetical protein BGO77_05300 [Caedibacter sp. 37-49]|nr:MAG: hypothetical protein BGO77_05300 [Caedibacter sp. 37-49]